MGYFLDGKKRPFLAWIPARGGSKGVSRKALQDLGGKPLMAYTIESALAIGGVDKVLVNTDDPEIADIAMQYGAEVPFLRPKELARDDSNLSDVVVHQLTWYMEKEGFIPDIHVAMSPTNPFRRAGLVDTALQLAMDNPNIYNISTVAPVDFRSNAYLNTANGPSVPSVLFQQDRQLCRTYYQSSFVFNLVLDCRANVPVRRPTPFIVNEIEAIDIDEMDDLTVARQLVAEALYPFPDRECKAASPVEDQYARHEGWGGKNLKIIRQKKVMFRSAYAPLRIFGCAFDLQQMTSYDRVIVNADYPMITKEDLEAFSGHFKGSRSAGISGCAAKVHPYRLMVIDATGYSEFLVDVPQSIRGDRHLYPEVLCGIPALIFIPGGRNAGPIFAAPEKMMVYRMDWKKLLRQGCLYDEMLIQSMVQKNTSVADL